MPGIQEFVSKLSDKEKKFFYITVLIVSLALIDRLFLGPSIDRLKTMDDEISQERSTVLRDTKFLAHKGKIVSQRQTFNKFFTAKVEDEDVINASFLRTVEKIATQNKVNLIKSNPSESKKEKNYNEYYANLDCGGKLDDVLKFMYMINSSDDLLKVTRFNLVPKKGTADEVNASMTIVKLVVTP